MEGVADGIEVFFLMLLLNETVWFTVHCIKLVSYTMFLSKDNYPKHLKKKQQKQQQQQQQQHQQQQQQQQQQNINNNNNKQTKKTQTRT